MSTSSTPATLTRSKLLGSFIAAIIISIGLSYIPYGRYVLYPFALLSTWAHEMGHGLGALVTGNHFDRLEIYSNLGGVAWVAGAKGLSQFVVSASGLVGPAVLGALVMILGSKERSASYILTALSLAIAITLVFWIRNLFGFIAMSAIALTLGLIARYARVTVRIVLAQLISVQLALSAWTGRGYLFIKSFERDGKELLSDTGQIEKALFLPYWFWGAFLGALTIVILAFGFWYAWLSSFKKERQSSSGLV